MSSIVKDFRYAFRTILKSPAFAAVAILSLALGIGPNTAIFSIVSSVLFQPWGVEDRDTVVDVYTMTSEGEYFYSYYRVYELLDEGATDVFEAVTASAQYSGHIEIGGEGELVLGEMVTGNYFDVLGVSAARGRTFLPEEDATPGTHAVVVVSHRFWQTRFGGDPGLVGDDLRLNGRPYTVVGIAPETFKGRIAPGVGTDFWVPLRMYPHLAPNQMGNGNLLVTARLRDGVTMAQTRQVVDAVAARFNEQRPESRSELELGAVNLGEVLLHPNFDSVITAMAVLVFAAVGLVLLVACVNLAGFLMARATDRRKEMAVRIAMGAGRGAIVRQLLVESVVLAALGGLVGLVLGVAASRMIVGIDPPLDVPINLTVGLDVRLLLFTGGASLLAALLFGLTPALEATRAPVASTLRDESSGSGGRGKKNFRKVLVAAQMALSTILIFGAGLFVRSLDRATGIDTGFDTGPAAVVRLEAWASEMDQQERTRFVETLVRRVEAEPGIEEVGVTGRMPLDLGVTNTSFEIPGVEPPPDRNRHVIEFTAVSPGYFETMDIELLEGRNFDARDGESGQRVAILTRAASERYWPGESALGRVLYRHGDPEQDVIVIGVVEDAKIWSLTENPRTYMYVPLAQNPFGRYTVVARGSSRPSDMARFIRAESRRLAPDVFVSEAGTMDDHLAYIYFLPRLAAATLSLVGALALALACIGLYGMVSYAVSRRTREMGIRLALGADAGAVVAMVVRSGVAVVVVGGLVGVVASLGLGSAVERFLIGVDGLDALSLLAAPVVLVGVATLAAWLPARRASRVDPVKALRSE